MEHYVRALPRGETHGLRITPALVANGNTEGEVAGMEDAALGAGPEQSISRGVELTLVLPSLDSAIGIEHEAGYAKTALNKALRAQNDGDLCFCRGSGDLRPGMLQEVRIGRRNCLRSEPIPRNELFRKANNPRPGASGFLDSACCQRDSLIGCIGKMEVGEGDANHA